MNSLPDFTKCIIVGAGLSGLSCANELLKKGFSKQDILIVEANSYVGGRVKTIREVDINGNEYVIDCGAQILHGEHTSLFELSKQLGLKTTRFFCTSQGDGGPDDEPINGGIGKYCVLGKNNEVKWYKYNTKDKDFVHAHKVLHGLVFVPKDKRNISMLEYLKNNNVSEEMICLFEAGYANTCCSSLANLSLSKMIDWNLFWGNQPNNDDDGDYDCTINRPYGLDTIIKFLSKEIKIKLNSTIKKINYSKNIIKLETGTESFSCQKLIISVSVGVLKNEIIKFTPTLPKTKIEALKSVDFRNALKIFVFFDKPFWKSNLDAMVCGGFKIPEFWPEGMGKKNCLTGFATAEAADVLLSFNDSEIVDKFLLQLSLLFPKSFEFSKLIDSRVERWDKFSSPNICGGYSSPNFSPTFQSDYSEILAAAVDKKIYFCGEATNVNEGSTMPSAIDSGKRAANDVVLDFSIN